MEAILGNYKLEKQAFIPLWKKFSFPNGLFKILQIHIFLCIWELPHRQGGQGHHCSQAPQVHVSLRRAISNPLPSYLGDSLCCPLRAEPGGRGGMIVQHQKQQQSICKLPSWKYMQTRREGCHGWKKAVIPKSFLYTGKFTHSTCSTVQSHWSYSPPLPGQEGLLKCERSRPSAPRSLTLCCHAHASPAQGGCMNHDFSSAGVPPLFLLELILDNHRK